MGLTWTMSIALTVYGIFLLFPETIVSLFVENDPELVATTVTAGRIYFSALIFQGLNIMLMYFFQSIEQPSTAFQIAILRGVVFLLPAMLCLGTFVGAGGIWFTLTVAEACLLYTS